MIILFFLTAIKNSWLKMDKIVPGISFYRPDKKN
jgi:hypothetical protein